MAPRHHHAGMMFVLGLVVLIARDGTLSGPAIAARTADGGSACRQGSQLPRAGGRLERHGDPHRAGRADLLRLALVAFASWAGGPISWSGTPALAGVNPRGFAPGRGNRRCLEARRHRGGAHRLSARATGKNPRSGSNPPCVSRERSSGKVDGVVAITRDVTQQKDLEEKARDAGHRGWSHRPRQSPPLRRAAAGGMGKSLSRAYAAGAADDRSRSFQDVQRRVRAPGRGRVSARHRQGIGRGSEAQPRISQRDTAAKNSPCCCRTRMRQAARGSARRFFARSGSAGIAAQAEPSVRMVTASIGGAVFRPGADRIGRPRFVDRGG